MPLVHFIGQRLAELHTNFVNLYSHITSPFVRNDHEVCGVLRGTVHSTGTNPYFVFEASVIDPVAASAVRGLLLQLNSRAAWTVL